MNTIEAISRALVITADMDPDQLTTDLRRQWFHMTDTAKQMEEALNAMGFVVVSKIPDAPQVLE